MNDAKDKSKRRGAHPFINQRRKGRAPSLAYSCVVERAYNPIVLRHEKSAERIQSATRQAGLLRFVRLSGSEI
jgi:hypothetical protein